MSLLISYLNSRLPRVFRAVQASPSSEKQVSLAFETDGYLVIQHMLLLGTPLHIKLVSKIDESYYAFQFGSIRVYLCPFLS